MQTDTATKKHKTRPGADALRDRVRSLASEREYQHHDGANPACVPGSPNLSLIAREVGVSRARVQQIMREAARGTADSSLTGNAAQSALDRTT